MVAPLNIHRMVGHQSVHDGSCSRTSVKNIPHDMQMIHNKTLNQIAHSHNEFLSTINADDRIDDLIVVCLFIQDIFSLVKKFFYDIGEVFRQCLSDF